MFLLLLVLSLLLDPRMQNTQSPRIQEAASDMDSPEPISTYIKGVGPQLTQLAHELNGSGPRKFKCLQCLEGPPKVDKIMAQNL